jgi:hypothetical protein
MSNLSKYLLHGALFGIACGVINIALGGMSYEESELILEQQTSAAVLAGDAQLLTAPAPASDAPAHPRVWVVLADGRCHLVLQGSLNASTMKAIFTHKIWWQTRGDGGSSTCEPSVLEELRDTANEASIEMNFGLRPAIRTASVDTSHGLALKPKKTVQWAPPHNPWFVGPNRSAKPKYFL